MRYPGGKNGAGTLQRIIGLMPLHRNYFELFLGSGAVIRHKTPAIGVNVGADVDPSVIAIHGGCGRKRWGDLRHDDALQILSSDPAMRDPETLVYLDPPYLRSTRTRLIYSSEMASSAEHLKLLRAVKRCRCMVMISGYWSDLYARELRTWRVAHWPAMTRGGLREEYVWMNFGVPREYHDPIYAAVGFRARERVKRRAARWSSRFATMMPAERQVVWSALMKAIGDRSSSDPTMRTASRSLAMRVAEKSAR